MNREATGLAGVRHIAYETLGSTNAEALALARAGERGPLWITAQSQSAGRGRRGSTWISPPGNLYATLLLTEPSPPALAPQLSFVAALALHDAVAPMRAAARAAAQGQMAERSAAGRRQARRHPDRRRERAALSRSPSASASIAPAIRPTPHFPATDLLQAGAVVTPEALFAALGGRHAAAAGAMAARGGLCRDPRRLAQARRRPRRAHPRAAAGARTCRPLSGARRGRPPAARTAERA